MSAISVAVCSRTFSQHTVLRAELLARYPAARFNSGGVKLEGDALVQFLEGSERAIVALERIDGALLDRVPSLKVVSKYGVGLDNIDLGALRQRAVRLGWRAGVNRRAVSELVVAMILSLLRQLPTAHRELSAGVWRQPHGFNLSGRVVGVVGCGNIGKDLVPILRSFDCSVLVHDILDFPEFYAAHQVEAVGLDELLSRADVVTLHVPLDGSTHHLIDARRLALLKPSAILVNAARGGVVDESALKRALHARRFAGAALDVFTHEPPDDHELLSLPNVLLSPHIGGSSHEAILAMGRAAIDGLDVNEVPSEFGQVSNASA